MELQDFWVGDVLTPILIGVFSILLLYWNLTRNFNYWKKRGVPYLKPIPFFGSVLGSMIKPYHEYEMENYKKLGPIYGHFEGNRALLSVADPDLMRNILVKDFANFTSRRTFDSNNAIINSMLSVLHYEDWRRVRQIITPTFTSGKLKRMLGIFKECSQTLIQNFKSAAEGGKPVDVKKFYGALAMDVIASSAFSTKIDSHNDPENRFVRSAKDVFSTSLSWRFWLLQLVPWFTSLLNISFISPNVINFFKEVTMQIIEERKRTGQTRNDFLQLLMDTAKEEFDDQKQEKEDDSILSNYDSGDSSRIESKKLSNKSLSIDELVGNCVIFFLAGYDTTGGTLTLVTYSLATNPEVQEKLYQEIKNVLHKSNGEVTYDAIQEMKYLDNVISETLRIYSPVARIERIADNDYKLGDTGITIPKGMVVSIPNYALQNDPKYFPNPEKFDPDRFTPEERSKRDPMAYIPFGNGPRNCVGMRFALLEMKICLVYVVSHFRIKRCTQTKVPLEFNLGPGLMSPKSVITELEPRKEKISLK